MRWADAPELMRGSVSVLIVAQSEIPALLPMRECIDLMASILASLARVGLGAKAVHGDGECLVGLA